jgi:hypothetical protein
MSLSQSEEVLLQALRNDVDRLIANGRSSSREHAGKDDGATRIQATKTAHGFIRGNGVYLDDADDTWKKINGTTFVYEDYVWGIVSFVHGVNRFSVIINGEVKLPSATFTPGAPYEFNASGVLVAATTRLLVKATRTNRVMIGASGSGVSGGASIDVMQTAHGFTVGKFICYDKTTVKYEKTDNTNPERQAVRGFVSAVIDADNFTLALEGWTGISHGTIQTEYLTTNGDVSFGAPLDGSALIPVLYPVLRGANYDSYFNAIFPPPQSTLRITQVAHGFVVGNAICRPGSAYAKAKADLLSTSHVVGVVVQVVSVDIFVIASSGVIKGAYSPGALLYVSTVTAGQLTSFVPSSGLIVPVLVGISSTDAAFVISEPVKAIQFGDATLAGVIRVASSVGVVVEVDASLISSIGKKLTVREFDVCENGVAKKVLMLASATY